jgi:D-alanyl-D-alanine carboxypeptidase (penicillin-binding protein 5/6)
MQRLGMHGTHFEDASGLPSPTHYSTARDLATLSRAIIRDFPEYYGLYSLREFTWNNIRQENRNGLLERDPSVDGIKTGHTETAGYCLISSAKRSGMRLISVVLGARGVVARETGSAALLNYGFSTFETVSVRKAGEAVLKPRVYKGTEQYVAPDEPRRAGHRAAWPGHHGDDAHAAAPAAHRTAPGRHRGR